MGRILLSTPGGVGVGNARRMGYDQPVADPLDMYQLTAHADWVDIESTWIGVAAVRANTDLWANDWYNMSAYGGLVYGQNFTGDYYNIRYVSTGFKKVFGNTTSDGVWALTTSNELRYTGIWYGGCGLAETPYLATGDYVYDLDPLAGTWSDLLSISGAPNQYENAFNRASGVLTAGNNYDGMLWDDNDALSIDVPAPFSPTADYLGNPAYTAKLVESDGWDRGVMLTSTNEIRYFALEFIDSAYHMVSYHRANDAVALAAGPNGADDLLYLKTDGSLWHVTIIDGDAPDFVHAGPFASMHIDKNWGCLTLVDTLGKVHFLDAYGGTWYHDVFPGVVAAKAISSYGVVALLEADAPPLVPDFWQDFNAATEVA